MPVWIKALLAVDRFPIFSDRLWIDHERWAAQENVNLSRLYVSCTALILLLPTKSNLWSLSRIENCSHRSEQWCYLDFEGISTKHSDKTCSSLVVSTTRQSRHYIHSYRLFFWGWIFQIYRASCPLILLAWTQNMTRSQSCVLHSNSVARAFRPSENTERHIALLLLHAEKSARCQ